MGTLTLKRQLLNGRQRRAIAGWLIHTAVSIAFTQPVTVARKGTIAEMDISGAGAEIVFA
jgi:hypothetical protein